MRRRGEVERLIAQWTSSRAGAPVIGLARTPHALTDSLRAASTQATSSTLVLARLEVSDGQCRTLLDELHERADDSERDSAAVASVARRASQALDPVDVMRLAAILQEIAHHADDAGEWWCRATACRAQMRGAGGALRDAMRALDSAILALDAARLVLATSRCTSSMRASLRGTGSPAWRGRTR
jgi:hypothetical protein